MASSVIASQTTLFLRHTTAAVSPRLPTASLSLTSAHMHRRPLHPSSSPISKPLKSSFSASISPTIDISPVKSAQTLNSDQNFLSGSTRTVTTLFAIAIAATKLFAHRIFSLAVQLKEPLLSSAGPAFFAAMKDVPTGSLNTPFTVVAAGMAKWLDLYSGVLMVRVLLSWFPNIPWDRQPLSAIRDLCDPYLNLFRNIIPPIFDTLDVSPLLAFAVLGTLGSILSSSRQAY
ncbi:uncharacterized protein ycf19 [Phtheirospermum japonicum]|uniref:Uncharacterized protein ycf19 n=1 Tax=Phtheirospermum japonicum TaxID=374723 RepID=A0A830D1B2_9LAMI|nr:uncharacterized protein ycf19 [Phtheirospermum japonicum]